ncbi:TlyA family RNA methyltransferase [Gryllotalpicola sp.]|uniref:TlyA family RNA methyltransferase n=1 Tax=Gryllotalpicola sp. TaxID=1932787 RepID=UPI002627C683|nr:TlyA family RNA methyltransferase [Gryllotalpicola sp.]
MPQRLDAALVARGLVPSRTRATRLIGEGRVSVDGRTVLKASAPVDESADVRVAELDHYVSRGAHKLIAALDAFGIGATGRLALDAGASTGGFTQVLLERGARRVLAIDVGHGQLANPLRLDPRVVNIEGVNLRALTPAQLAHLAKSPERPDLVAADLSFISLTQVLSALVESAAPGSDFVLLVKPQFEVGRQGVREGIVRDGGLRADAVANVLWAGHDLGLRVAGLIPSPLVGTHGNREFLAHLTASAGTHPTEWLDTIASIAGG